MSNTFIKISVVLLALQVGLISFFLFPDLSKKYVFLQARDRVVKVTNRNETTAGTGVFVKTTAGTIVLTNSHVCVGLSDTGFPIQIKHEKLGTIAVTILANNPSQDLCALSTSDENKSFPDNYGITISQVKPSIEEVVIAGHPYGQKSVYISIGYLLGIESVQAPIDKPKEGCPIGTTPVVLRSVFGVWGACEVSFNAYVTNILAFPGNSGSPVINSSGQLVGLISLTDSRTNYASAITLEAIREFLAPVLEDKK